MSTAPGSRKAEATKQLRDNIRLLTNEYRDWVDRTMSPEGLTVAQLRLLYAVQQEPAGSAAAIARQCQVTPQTLQSMLERAVREGWLVRKPAVRNARILTSALTPRGAALLQKAKRHVTRFDAEVWRDSTAAELEAANALFARALKRIARVSGQPAKPARGKPSVTGEGSQRGEPTKPGGGAPAKSARGSKRSGKPKASRTR